MFRRLILADIVFLFVGVGALIGFGAYARLLARLS